MFTDVLKGNDIKISEKKKPTFVGEETGWRNIILLEILTDKTHQRAVLALAIPMILSNITVPLLGLVDTAVIGHLSEPYYLGGVAEGSMVISMILWLLGALRMSTTGLTAQAFGSRDNILMRGLLYQGLGLAFVLGLLVIVLAAPISWIAFSLTNGSHLVRENGELYFSIRVLSTPAALANMVLIGWMLGMQNARATLLVTVFHNALNIILDLTLVWKFEMNVDGVAYASMISDYVTLILALIVVAKILKKRDETISWSALKSVAFEKKRIRSLLLINRDILLRSLFLQICFAFMTFEGARLGDIVVAANAVLINFLYIAAYGLDGFAHAAEALIGKAHGEKDLSKIKLAIGSTVFTSFVLSVCCSLAFALWGEKIIALVTNLAEVRTYANKFIIWVALLPVVAVLAFALDGVFIGATKAKEMRNAMIVSSLAVFFPVYFMLSSLGNHALWAAMLAFMGARGITLAAVLAHQFRAGKFV